MKKVFDRTERHSAAQVEVKFNQRVAELANLKKFDEIWDAETFGEMNKQSLIVTKIHELFEKEKIDFVDEDNSHQDVAVHTTDDGFVVLCLPQGHFTFRSFDAVYDALMKNKVK